MIAKVEAASSPLCRTPNYRDIGRRMHKHSKRMCQSRSNWHAKTRKPATRISSRPFSYRPSFCHFGLGAGNRARVHDARESPQRRRAPTNRRTDVPFVLFLSQSRPFAIMGAPRSCPSWSSYPSWITFLPLAQKLACPYCAIQYKRTLHHTIGDDRQTPIPREGCCESSNTLQFRLNCPSLPCPCDRSSLRIGIQAFCGTTQDASSFACATLAIGKSARC